MYETESKKKHEFYLVYSLAAIILVSSLIMSNAQLAVLSSATLLLAVILFHSGHIVNNILIKNSKIIEVSGNYQLSKNLNSISRSDHDLYKSISIAVLTPRNNTIASNSLKELLDSLSEQFEFSIELAEIDKSKIMENLMTKLRMKEIALSRLDNGSSDKINHLKRQIDIINGEISHLGSGGKSFEFEIKIKSIYLSEDRSEAEFYSSKNIETLASKFSAALGLDYQILTSERLLTHSGV